MGGQRSREKSYGSIYSEDDNYRVAPRISNRRPESMYYERRDAFSPTRDAYDDRPDPRRMSRRYEDQDVVSRGFGVRAPSVEERDRRSDSIDSRHLHRSDSLVASNRRDYAAERGPGEEVRSDVDRREPERAPRYEEPQFAREKPIREKERDPPRERNVPREKEREYEDDRRLRERERERDRDRDRERDREREHLRVDRDREYDRYSGEERRPREKRIDREVEPDRRERIEEKSHDEHDFAPHVPGALAGTAAAGALAYGANEALGRRERERKEAARDDHDECELPREDTQRDERVKENKGRQDSVVAEERARAPVKAEGREFAIREEESPDAERARARHYIAKEEAAAKEARDSKSAPAEILDPEEDYRRRVAQEMERVKGAREEEASPIGADRDRRRRERDMRHTNAYESPRESTSDNIDDSKALMPIERNRENSLDTSSDTVTGSSDTSREKRVAIVEPAREKERPKSILRKPTEKFPEDPNPVREGVAPLKDAKNKNIPAGARWTKIDRRLVNPEALDAAQERFEERKDCVIVLRVLTKEDIQKFADKTKEIRGTLLPCVIWLELS